MDMLKLRMLNNGDLQLIENWLNKAHIKKWYEVPGLCSIDDWLSEIKGRNDEFRFITHFIALWEERPIGFCQYYKCMDVEEDWYGDIALCGTYSIDYLIGEETYLGKGIGKSIVALLVKEIFSLTDSERIIVQPDGENKASCNSLLSNGFIFDAKNNVYIITK
jgi:RimJ/RimL family protein N-acetyltransferase